MNYKLLGLILVVCLSSVSFASETYTKTPASNVVTLKDDPLMNVIVAYSKIINDTWNITLNVYMTSFYGGLKWCMENKTGVDRTNCLNDLKTKIDTYNDNNPSPPKAYYNVTELEEFYNNSANASTWGHDVQNITAPFLMYDINTTCPDNQTRCYKEIGKTNYTALGITDPIESDAEFDAINDALTISNGSSISFTGANNFTEIQLGDHSEIIYGTDGYSTWYFLEWCDVAQACDTDTVGKYSGGGRGFAVRAAPYSPTPADYTILKIEWQVKGDEAYPGDVTDVDHYNYTAGSYDENTYWYRRCSAADGANQSCPGTGLEYIFIPYESDYWSSENKTQANITFMPESGFTVNLHEIMIRYQLGEPIGWKGYANVTMATYEGRLDDGRLIPINWTWAWEKNDDITAGETLNKVKKIWIWKDATDPRADVPNAYRWNLTEWFVDPSATSAEFDGVSYSISNNRIDPPDIYLNESAMPTYPTTYTIWWNTMATGTPVTKTEGSVQTPPGEWYKNITVEDDQENFTFSNITATTTIDDTQVQAETEYLKVIVYPKEETALNDSSTTKTHQFTTAEEKTEYINVPKNATVTNAKLSLEGTKDIEDATEISFTESYGNLCPGCVNYETYAINGSLLNYKTTMCGGLYYEEWKSGYVDVYAWNYDTEAWDRKAHWWVTGSYATYVADWMPFGDSYRNYSNNEVKVKIHNTHDTAWLNWCSPNWKNEFNYTPYNYTWDVNFKVNNTVKWTNTGKFSSEDDFPYLTRMPDFATEINTFLSTCTEDGSGNCQLPITINSTKAGNITIKDISVEYHQPITVDITPPTATADCDSGSPTFTDFSAEGDTWKSCKEDTDTNGVIDYFKWIQPRTSQGVIKAGGSSAYGPTIDPALIDYPTTVDPLEGTTVSYTVSFVANDENGYADLNNTTAKLTVQSTISGGSNYTNTTCSPAYYNSTAINYTCTVYIQYYEPPGSKTITVYIEDNQGASASDNSKSVTVNSLTAYSVTYTTAPFGTVSLGQTDVACINNPIKINNTGNVNLNITVNGTDMVGQTDSNYVISIGNIAIDDDATPSEEVETGNAETALTTSPQNYNPDATVYGATYVKITDATQEYPYSVYYFLDVPSSGLLPQDYQGTTIIEGSAA